MTSLSSIVSNANSVIAQRPATTSASDALQSLFGQLHMDAIASATTSSSATGATAATSTGTASSTSASDVVGDVVPGLRSVLDGAVSTASAARSIGKAAAAYASGGGLAGLAAHAVSKLA